MRKDDVKKYSIEEDPHSGLELELQFMPRFFHDHKDAPTAPHAHEFYQIIWFRRGHGSHMVDFVNYPVSDNTIFFVAPGQIHAFDSTDTFEGVIIHFNASFMADEESSESVFLKYDVFNAYDSLPYYKVSGEEEGRLMLLVNEMNREYSLTGAFAHKEYMQNLLRLFLIRVQRGGERKAKPKLYVTSVANRTFVLFRKLLEEHFRTMHTVQEYADLLNISARTLTKYVRQSAHCSPLQIVNDRIVLEAKRQLQHSTLSVKEIGYRLGFEDPSYFVKFFKRLTAHMPTDFRNGNSHYHNFNTGQHKEPYGKQQVSTANGRHEQSPGMTPQGNDDDNNNQSNKNKEETMKQLIAIPTAGGSLFPHFGKAPQVTVFDIEGNSIKGKQVLTAPEHAHGAMPRFLQGLGVTDVICGGLGAGAVNMLNEMGIDIHGGAPSISVDEVIKLFLDGTIVYGDSTCHHDACDKHHHE